MLECKCKALFHDSVTLYRINRYMLECKFNKHFPRCVKKYELIDTCWNVNKPRRIHSGSSLHQN